jgi:hypothetical protein
MIELFIISCFCILCCEISISREGTDVIKYTSIKKNSIYEELIGGKILSLSVNYELLFNIVERINVSGQPSDDFCHFGHNFIPLEMSLKSGDKHCLEFGGDISIFRDGGGRITLDIFAPGAMRAGYNYNHTKGILLRIGSAIMIKKYCTPFLSVELSHNCAICRYNEKPNQ